MDLRSRSKLCKKNEIKTFPLVSQLFLVAVRTEWGTHCALCSRKDEGTIYIKITVATGVGDATTPNAYEDHSSNRPMR
jgi:hypothetical protein